MKKSHEYCFQALKLIPSFYKNKPLMDYYKENLIYLKTRYLVASLIKPFLKR